MKKSQFFFPLNVLFFGLLHFEAYEYSKHICKGQLSKKSQTKLNKWYDDFSTKFIKLAAPLIAPFLEKLFNLALSSGVYPDNLKIAKVIPIFKKGDSTSVNNYRPISILSPINKIFEKNLYVKLMTYINNSNILYKY